MKSIKKIIFIIFIVPSYLSFSQLGGNGPVDIPKIFPVSPEAATLGKYGEIPVNMANGVTNQTIPIYTIKESGYELPISVNYNYTGLIVDDIPGVTGLGWSLSAGGIITRQLRGRPDEEPGGYIGDNRIGLNWVLPYINNQLSSEDRQSFEENSASGGLDTQPDKFMINVGNIQASFYFDENKNVVIKPYKPYKIEVINGDFEQGFKVTDDSGIQYFFESTEITKRIAPFGINDILSTPVNGYISSWKLTKIELTNNKTITLRYAEYNHKQRIFTQSYTKVLESSGGCSNNLRTSETRYSISSKIIESISFSLGTLSFVSTRSTATELNQYLARLDKIKIDDSFGKEILNYDLIYDDNNKTRKLLKSIIINNETSNSYQFQYKGNPSDNIAFTKQDFWGYANANSTGRLIDIDDLYGPRKPSFALGSVGALKKVIYPTKGSTEFVYEQNTYDPGVDGDEYDDFYDVEISPCSIHNDFYIADAAVAYPNSGNDSQSTTFTITERTAVEIDMSVTKASLTGNVEAKIVEVNTNDHSLSACQDFVRIKDCNRNTPCTIAALFYGGGFLQPGESLTKDFRRKVYLKPGTYSVFVNISNAFTTEQNRYIAGSVRVNVNRGNVLPPQARSRETGGIRIKQIKNCPDNNPANCILKEYIYENTDGISEGVLFRRRNLTTYDYGTSTLTNGSDNPNVQTCVFRSYSSSSNLPLGYYMGSHIIYKQVIERFTSANGNNGNRKLTFNHTIPAPIGFPFINKDGNAYKNGKLLKEEITKSDGTLVKETVNHYDFDDNLNLNRRVYAVKVGQTGFSSLGPGIFISDQAVFSANRNVDRLIQTTETHQFDGTDMHTQNFYRYNNPQGHIKEQETINSRNEKISTKYFYSYDFNTAINNSLTELNRISTPIETKVFRDQELLNTKSYSYKNWSNAIILPEIIKTAKTNNSLEPRLTHHKYDNYGNPLEVSKADGMHISYIWGYNQQHPVAKIENATREQIEALSGFGPDFHTEEVGLSSIQENTLRIKLPDAMITTYAYDPLIGVTSMTDPRGYTMTYHYDEFNRLEFVKDADGKLVSENKYNYKN